MLNHGTKIKSWKGIYSHVLSLNSLSLSCTHTHTHTITHTHTFVAFIRTPQPCQPCQPPHFIKSSFLLWLPQCSLLLIITPSPLHLFPSLNHRPLMPAVGGTDIKSNDQGSLTFRHKPQSNGISWGWERARNRNNDRGWNSVIILNHTELLRDLRLI